MCACWPRRSLCRGETSVRCSGIRKNSETPYRNSCEFRYTPMDIESLANSRTPSHPRAQNFGNGNAAVGLLPIFENRYQRPADSDSGAVERMNKMRSPLAGTFEADIEAACLKIGAVGSAGHFAIL